jgi:hypothetical protein
VPDREIILHVGIHKTGSTSIQRFLDAHRQQLCGLGIEFYTGQYIPSNHMELHGAAMRPSRMSPFKMRRKVAGDPAYVSAVRARISTFASNSTCSRLLFSAEGLSYLCYPDEMERLKDILPPAPVKIIMYVRERGSFLRSYQEQVKRTPPIGKVEADSYAYLEPDSWLLDFGERHNRFCEAFGAQNVVMRSYEEEMESRGNVIPSFLEVLGILDQFKASDWEGVFLNRTATKSESP